ncbi:MAG: hypothetical protein KAW17_10510 [Candidatus Eisenbacteria sp.]|nr:hypothetical protein [Candidatus Eisenbacteria bacterium]
MTLWKWVEAGVLTALAHQAVRAASSMLFLGPFYMERGQLWRVPGDRTFAWLPLVYLFLGFSLAYVYRRVRVAIGGCGWRSGLRFGFGVWIIAAVPYQGARFVLMPIPGGMALTEVVGDLVAYLISGLILARLLEDKVPAPVALPE